MSTSNRPRRCALIAGGAAFGIAALIGPAVAANAAPVAPTATQTAQPGDDQRPNSVRGVAVTVQNATSKPFTVWDHTVNPGEKFGKAGAGGAFAAEKIAGTFAFPNGSYAHFMAMNVWFKYPEFWISGDLESEPYSEGDSKIKAVDDHAFQIARQGDTAEYKEFTIKVTDC